MAFSLDDTIGKCIEIFFRIKAKYGTPHAFVIITSGALLIYLLFPEFETYHPAGVLVSDAPQQTPLPVDTPSFSYKKYQVQPLASYDVTGRILAKNIYYFGREADISPIDLGIGWQELSDSHILQYYKFHMSHRYLTSKWKEPMLPEDVLNRRASNHHLIPATHRIETALKATHVGDIVHLKGFLVRISADDGYSWSSSLSREDSGWGACELMHVLEYSKK